MTKNARPIEDLILTSLSEVLKRKETCTFGDLVKECFDLYPDHFSLSDYPNLPDSLKLDRPLRSLTHEKRLIIGNPKTFFRLTNSGKEYLLKLDDISNADLGTGSQPTRSPALAMIKKIRESKEFKKFLSDRLNYIPNNMRIRALARFTLETPTNTVNHFLNYILKTAVEINDEPTKDFITIYINYYKSRK